MLNEILTKEKINIENMIYEIRGKQVMIDSDLAKLYQCKNGTKSINLAVSRNLEKFPNDFYFQLTKEEFLNLKFQIETSSCNDYGGIRKLPYVFTEQGVAMLSSVIHTSIANYISVNIMRAFVAMRKYVSNNLIEQKYINNMVLKHDEEIRAIQNTFNSFKQKNTHIFYEGQIYDAYSLLLDIFETAKNEIIIIDNYIDKKILDIVCKNNKNIIICSKNIDRQLIEKYNSQYNNLKIIINNSFHDRFIIIDKRYLYHCGASFKDLGKKCFAINKLEDNEYLQKIIQLIN